MIRDQHIDCALHTVREVVLRRQTVYLRADSNSVALP